jgi:prepilin signal peptidase PulO-like enzyme (type II secretory pathway)
MTYIRARTFCCCLPVRFGVFILTILGMLGGTFLAVFGWLAIVKLQGQLPKANEIALYIQSVLYTLLGIISVFGFIGACVKNRTMISLFFMILVAHLTFSIFTGAFALYQIFNVTVPNAVQQCIDNGTQSASDCQTAYNVAKGVIVAIFIIVWLLEIYACIITDNYVGQLDDEEAAEQWPKPSDVEAGPRPLR